MPYGADIFETEKEKIRNEKHFKVWNTFGGLCIWVHSDLG